MKNHRIILSSLLMLSLLVAASFACAGESKSRPFLGVEAGEITSELASDYGVQPGMGIIVEAVTNGSPADNMGLRSNDVITAIDGTRITGPEEFRVQIKKHKPADQIQITYYRGGKEKTAAATLSKRDDEVNWSWGGNTPGAPAPKAWAFHWNHDDQADQGYAGLYLQELSDGLREYFRVEEGVLISEVVDGSPAEKAGLKSGDIIIKVAGEAMDDESEIRREIRRHKPGESLDFTVKRDGSEQTISVKLGSVEDGEDMGFFDGGNWDGNNPDFDIQIDELHSLQHEFQRLGGPERMDGLKDELDKLDIKIDALDQPDIPRIDIDIPLQLEISPDAPAAPERIEIRKARPIWDRTVWLESWQQVKNALSNQMDMANEGLVKLRARLAELREQIKERFA